jgi:curved DNA-binding protein CbpA
VSQSDEARLRRLLERLESDLDRLSYYNLLGVPPDASVEEIRRAFRVQALLLHPDRHFNQPDPALKRRITAIYKRVSEGYRVLNHPKQRPIYDQLLAFGEVRFSKEKAEQLARLAQDQGDDTGQDGAISHPQARQFYGMGKDALRRQQFKEAIAYFQQAQAVAPGVAKIRARLDEAMRMQRLYGG